MVLQIIINSLITGGLYSLVAFGFALIYNTLKFIPFFYGVLAIWAGYFLYLFSSLKIPFSISIILSTIVTILITLFLNSFLLKNFRSKKANSVILLILGLSIDKEGVVWSGAVVRMIKNGKPTTIFQ